MQPEVHFNAIVFVPTFTDLKLKLVELAVTVAPNASEDVISTIPLLGI